MSGGGGGAAKFGELYGDVDGMQVNAVDPQRLLLFELFSMKLFDETIVPDDGDRVCAVLVLCSDLIESGVCDLIELPSLFTANRFDDGGVCAPPVIIDDELESSSLSLSNAVCDGDFSPRLPCT